MSRGERVLVGMSGGLDSTVSVMLLREAGFDPVGVTLVLQASDDVSMDACGYAVGEDAARSARELGVEHELVDARDLFTERVLHSCWEVFSRGGTPNPCVFCNARIRFGMMVALAEQRGISRIATGHYAKMTRDSDGSFWLERGADAAKDQSYFLYGVSRALFPHILFPLGGMTKADVRARARAEGLAVAEKAESQDLCFAGPEGHFSEQLRQRFHGTSLPGVFQDESGHVLARHTGIHQYTIGQRRGLGFAAGERVKICAIDPRTGVITVSARPEAVMGLTAASDHFVWHTTRPLSVGDHVSAQVRYRQPPAEAVLTEVDGPRVVVSFSSLVFGITPGQSLVLYRGDRVLGGGEIA